MNRNDASYETQMTSILEQVWILSVYKDETNCEKLIIHDFRDCFLFKTADVKNSLCGIEFTYKWVEIPNDVNYIIK